MQKDIELNKECEYTDCIAANNNSCDAPEIDKYINIIYTSIPNFHFPQNGTLLNITNNPIYNFNYYIKLPSQLCEEIRILWPLTWMIPQLVQKLNGKLTGTGIIGINLSLDILSKKLIQDMALANPTLNTGNNTLIDSSRGLCNSVATYDYLISLAYTGTSSASTLSTTIPSTVIFSTPNNSMTLQFTIDPVTLNLISQDQANYATFVAATLRIITNQNFGTPPASVGAKLMLLNLLGISSPTLTAILTAQPSDVSPTVSITGATITITGTTGSYSFTVPGTFPSTSAAQYVSFVYSHTKNYWVATNIETSRV